MLNEAIIQSLLDQTGASEATNAFESRQYAATEALPLAETEEKVLKEVMKYSAFEYQKQSGQIDMSKLKRKQP
jgi:hypothetical protein